MSYEALTERLAKLRAAAKKQRVSGIVDRRQGEAKRALAAPAHEYAAVALAAVGLMKELDSSGPEDFSEISETAWDEMTDALDALQAAVVR